MPSKWPAQTFSKSQIRLGPERVVTFGPGILGVKLNRGSDGLVRILSTSTCSAQPGAKMAWRSGMINVGDVVRETGSVDLRRLIRNII